MRPVRPRGGMALCTGRGHVLLWVMVGIIFSCLAARTDGAVSGANSCLAEAGASACGLSSALAMTAGAEVAITLMVSDDAGIKCADDCAAGLVTASLGGTAADSVSYIGNGNYYVRWNLGSVSAAGSLALSVAISGADVSGSPATVTSATGVAVATRTHVFDNPSAGGVVGQPVSFSLQARDRYGNDVTAAASIGFSFSVKLLPIDVAAIVTPQGDGEYSVSYSCTAAGDYTLAVSSSDNMLNAQYAVTLRPGSPDASKFSGAGAAAGDAGALVQYVVQGRDSYGNALTNDADSSFSISVSQLVGGQYQQVTPSTAVNYDTEGRYLVTFTLTASASYSVSISSAGSAPVVGSPFTRAVNPAVRSAGDCVVAGNVISASQGAGTPQLSAGTTAQISVTSVDLYGNRYTQGDTSFSLAVSGPATCSQTMGDSGSAGPCRIVFTRSTAAGGSGDGSSTVTFILTQSGTYALALSLTDTHTSAGAALGASPYQLAVVANPAAGGARLSRPRPRFHARFVKRVPLVPGRQGRGEGDVGREGRHRAKVVRMEETLQTLQMALSCRSQRRRVDPQDRCKMGA